MLINIRSPKNDRERLKAALVSSVDDLIPDGNGRILVTGVLPNGDRIYLGDFDEALLFQKEVEISSVIERIRFGELRKRSFRNLKSQKGGGANGER